MAAEIGPLHFAASGRFPPTAGSSELRPRRSADASGTSRWLFVHRFDRLSSLDGSPFIEQIVQTLSQVWIGEPSLLNLKFQRFSGHPPAGVDWKTCLGGTRKDPI